MTDRQLGLFIGGTLELNVICLTIKLQLGGRGGKAVFAWISRGLQSFQDERYKRKKLKSGRITRFQENCGVYCVRFVWVGMQLQEN